MNRKLKNTLGLVVLLILVVAAGIIYNYIIQDNKIKDKQAKLKELQIF